MQGEHEQIEATYEQVLVTAFRCVTMVNMGPCETV